MKAAIILFLMICTGTNTNAQKTIEITYNIVSVSEGSSLYNLKVPDSKKPRSDWHSIISGDTTFAFASNGKNGKKRHLKKGRYPVRPLDHSLYYESKNHSLFEIVSNMGNFYIYSNDTSRLNPKNYWMDTTKTFLNFECQAAMIFNSHGDSSTMWIARNLKPGLITFHQYFTVPGIVMESLDLKHGIYYKAVNVEKTDNQIYFPANFKQVSLEEYVKGWTKKKRAKKGIKNRNMNMRIRQ